ncbi:MAG TPA: nucleotidyltransferase domain-containing protein [Candidatus Nanoarchaeia archaeon]|nr:nucleotidyltransferase domain-containing protein [Candidatus Nanoarchaeia archaeon]
MNWKTEVLLKVKPNSAEEQSLKNKVNHFLKKLDSHLKDAHAILGGSGAKNTWLKGEHDADIFVLFSEKYRDNGHKLADMLEASIKKLHQPYERLHGSRDYYRIYEEDFLFEIIPILHIKKAIEAKNITDVSPLHAAWVQKHASSKLCDEIRLTKAFCKAQKCYGAESYIRGFSGYVLEILTIHYGSFEKLLKASQKWAEKEIIDVAKLYKKKADVWTELNGSKLQSPLIIIDPVDKTRNAAAALSKERWLLFKEKASKFLKKQNCLFFERTYMTIPSLKSKKGKHHIVAIEIITVDGKEDKIGAQLLLAFDYLKKHMAEFDLIEADWEWDKHSKALFWFIVKNAGRPKKELRKGPPLEMKEYVADFKKKHKKTKLKDGHVWAEIDVKDYTLKSHVEAKLKDDYVKEKIKNGKLILL